MKRVLRHITTAFCLTLALPAAAQDRISTEESGGLLVDFLESTLSDDSRTIDVQGLSGTFSSKAQIDRLTVSDAEGVWLEIDGATLDWNRTALLRGAFSVNSLTATRIAVHRAPMPAPQDPNLPPPEAQAIRLPELPVAVTLGELKAERIELGAALVGQTSIWSLDGRLALAEGALDSALNLIRLDRPGDKLQLVTGFSNQTEKIVLDLTASEAPGGLLGSVLDLPGAPGLQLALVGQGPVSDFQADLDLATDGQTRLAGSVVLRAPPQSGPGDSETTKTLEFSADLNGDIDTLIPADYRPFFGPDLRLRIKGERFGDGGLALHSAAISSRALRLAGTALIRNAQLETANLRADIRPPKDAQRVVLPITGAATSLAHLSLNAQKAAGQTWRIRADLSDLQTAGAQLDHARLRADGVINQAPFDLSGDLVVALSGLQLSDPSLAAATGQTLQISTKIIADGQDIEARDLTLVGTDYALTGDLKFDGLSSGLQIDSDLTAQLADLARLSPLAGRPLAGTAKAQLIGRYAPLNGSFDTNLTLNGQDLQSGIAQLDSMISGRSSVVLQARRDENGLHIDQLDLTTQALAAHVNGQLSSTNGQLDITAQLTDLATLLPQAPGPLRLAGNLSRLGTEFTGQLELTGPHQSTAQLSGSANLAGNADLDFTGELGQLQRFIPQLAGTLRAKGTAQRRQGLWQIDSRAEGPVGVNAAVRGTWDEARARADLRAIGDLRLDVANLFIAPNLLTGPARFDLALKGTPGLDALSGTISTRASRLVLPGVSQHIEDISGQVTLNGPQARLSLTARPRDGGQLQVAGPVRLQPPFTGDLSIALRNIILSDNLVYRTELGGNLRLAGPLAKGGLLSGRIDVGETNIDIASAGGAIDAAPIPDIRHIGASRAVQQTRARAGLTGQSQSGTSSALALDLVVNAPNRIFARGRGLRAELGGALNIRGTAARPEPSGEIGLIRGSFDILGRRLTLDQGRITLLGSLTPYLDFSASTSTAQGSAALTITGPVDAPQIEVTSDPARPSEEALALLLFGDNVQDLSPLALARLAASAARLSGQGLDAESTVARETGADDVDIGFDNLGTGQLGLGGYVADNVYTDFNVNTRGESELSINLDLNQNLSVSGTVDSVGETGVGVFFKRDY